MWAAARRGGGGAGYVKATADNLKKAKACRSTSHILTVHPGISAHEALYVTTQMHGAQSNKASTPMAQRAPHGGQCAPAWPWVPPWYARVDDPMTRNAVPGHQACTWLAHSTCSGPGHNRPQVISRTSWRGGHCVVTPPTSTGSSCPLGGAWRTAGTME